MGDNSEVAIMRVAVATRVSTMNVLGGEAILVLMAVVVVLAVIGVLRCAASVAVAVDLVRQRPSTSSLCSQ